MVQAMSIAITMITKFSEGNGFNADDNDDCRSALMIMRYVRCSDGSRRRETEAKNKKNQKFQ